MRVTPAAALLASLARSAFCSTVEASCSIAAEVSSIVAACLVVRSERSLAPERISPVAALSARDVSRNCPTMSVSLSATALVSDLSLAKAP
ncbi:hypothetical protein D9M68_685810 [compost metagenome]